MINSFVIPLILTILIEGIAAFLIGYRDELFFLTLVLVNFITNPFLNYIIALINLYVLVSWYYYIIIPIEIIIAIIEGIIYAYALKKDIKSMIILSFILNTLSFLSGLLFLKLVM